MTAIITISNQKGGVGKTTTAVSLAHGIARAGKRVLLVDLDGQGNVARSLRREQEPGAFHLLRRYGSSKPELDTVRQWVRATGRDRFWYLPGNETTNTALAEMISARRSIDHIKWALEPVAEGMDCIVIDTPPSMNDLQVGALYAASHVLVPTIPNYLDIQQMNAVLEVLRSMRDDPVKRWRGALLGALPSFLEATPTSHQKAMEYLEREFGTRSLLLPSIHKANIISNCPALGKTIFEIDARRDTEIRAQQEYQAVVDRILPLVFPS